MRWVARGSRQARAGDANPADDGLDGLSWDVLCQSLAAAHRGDAGAHVAPLLRYEREVPVSADNLIQITRPGDIR